MTDRIEQGKGREALHRALPSARFYDVGGPKLMLYASGTGGPVVGFLPGAGVTGLGYLSLHEQASRFTTSLLYDRAGTGWSDHAELPRSATEVTDEPRSARSGSPAPAFRSEAHPWTGRAPAPGFIFTDSDHIICFRSNGSIAADELEELIPERGVPVHAEHQRVVRPRAMHVHHHAGALVTLDSFERHRRARLAELGDGAGHNSVFIFAEPWVSMEPSRILMAALTAPMALARWPL